MASVTLPEELGGDGRTYHDGVGVGGMAEGGHAQYWFLMIQALIAVAAFLVEKAGEAADAAASAANAPGTSATTVTPINISTGSKAIVLQQSGKLFTKGQQVKVASDADVSRFVAGPITAFSGTNMTINVDTVGGSGAFSDGIVSLSASAGVLPTRSISTSGLATGGGDFSQNRTISVARASAADIRKWIDTDRAITPGDMQEAAREITLQYGANITTQGDAVLDGARFINGVVFMAGDAFLPNLTNAKPGQCYRLRFVQDATGNRKITGWGNAYVMEGGKSAFTLTTAPGWSDYLYVDVVTAGLFVCSFVKGPYGG